MRSSTEDGDRPAELRRIVRKSIGYVTWDGSVLFFIPKELPGSGAELPGGTLSPGEDPRDGLLRELHEETGLTDFGTPQALGMVEFDPADGQEAVHHRHFYHVPMPTAPPKAWDRVVEEGNGTFTFQFFWVSRDSVPTHVHPGHDVYLESVFDLLIQG